MMKIFWRILRICLYALLLLIVVSVGALVVLTGPAPRAAARILRA